MVKVVDVAKEANVSPATVSRVLNNSLLVTPEKRERVQAAIEKLGYVPVIRPGKVDKGQYDKMIVVIADSINPMAMDAMMWAANEERAALMFLPMSESAPANTQNILNTLRYIAAGGNPYGVMLVDTMLPQDEELISYLSDCPVVQVGDCAALPRSCVVTVDAQKAAYDAVQYLAKCGCKSFLMMLRSNDEMPILHEQKQLWGYRMALMELGYRPEQMAVQTIDRTVDGGREYIEDLIARGEELPQAIVCSTDEVAVGCIRGLTRNGIRVPEQVAVIGLGNNRMGDYITPSLTTVAASQSELGIQAVRLLLQVMSGAQTGNVVVPLLHQLIVNESTKTLPGADQHDNWA